METIQITQYGSPDVLQCKETATISPEKLEAGQALVEIAFAGLNFIDIYQRKGIYPLPLPYTPGLEASGTVKAIGAGVTCVKPGDRVAYTDQIGSYAKLNIVQADRLIPLPDEISFQTGAAFPLQAMTAHYLLHEFYTIKPGDVVLIHAAAGGMGLLLVQWARHLGAFVIGTCSTKEKAEAARNAGAHEVILYTTQNFVTEVQRITNGKGATLIIDGVGKSTFAGNLEAASLRGHIVIFGSASGPADPISPNFLMGKSLTLSGGKLFDFILDRKELLYRANAALKGIQEGYLKLHIRDCMPLKDAALAHTLLETRQTIGKLLLAL